jgi:glycosyltransferase involved in cell wall biosynthesis
MMDGDVTIAVPGAVPGRAGLAGAAIAYHPAATAPASARLPSRPRRPLTVGVLVDLALTDDAGGHVKCWQRLAEAAVDCPDLLDLTVHYSGPAPRRIRLSPTVRYEILPPVLSTARLVKGVPDDTDLARWHPRLAHALSKYDVIHTTDAFFCYARTATRFVRRHRTPLVSSIHTNTPEYARITMAKLLERWLGSGLANRAATEWLRIPDRVSGLLARRLAAHLTLVTAAIGGFTGESASQPGSGLSLRRGIDRATFNPRRRDRGWLERRFNLPGGHLVVMYAGKLNAGKNVPLLAPIITGVRDTGIPVHLFCAGQGTERAALETALGPALTCAGVLDQDELARAYASADLFVFPSEIDEFGNAALEALASGLPTFVAHGSGIARSMADCPAMWVLPGNDPAAWVAAIVELAAAPRRRLAIGRAARAFVEARVPNWLEVLQEDLLPVWREAAARRRR